MFGACSTFMMTSLYGDHDPNTCILYLSLLRLLDYRNDDHYPDSNDLVPLTIELRPKATNDTTYVGFLLPTTEVGITWAP